MSVYPLNSRASDLGVAVVLEQWCVDSWCTRVRYHLEGAHFPYCIGGARLVPLLVSDNGTRQPADPLPLLRLEPSSDEPIGGVLVFGGLPLETTHATLLVTRLQLAEGQEPHVMRPATFDPYDPMDVASDREALSALFQWDDYDQSLAPEWEVRGQWSFELTLPRAVEDRRLCARFLLAVGSVALSVPWVDCGDHGTLIAIDAVPSVFASYGTGWKEVALRAHDGAAPVPVPSMKLHLEQGATVWDGATHGPYGLLRTRHYLEAPLCHDASTLSICVDEANGLRFSFAPPTPFGAEGVVHTFAAQTLESEASFDIDLAGVGLDGVLHFNIHDVYGEHSCFVILYETRLESSEVRAAWLTDVHVIDGEGTVQMCVEDGLQPLKDLRLDAAEGVRALRFGPINANLPISLYIGALDVAFKRPLRANLNLGTLDRAQN